ncbi:MAG: hypothetical protein N4A64_02280 [Marinisporobacter sp.]|jgi:hypothetical protein|nr:hypothetical protein [Marinisporobacter sp.]
MLGQIIEYLETANESQIGILISIVSAIISMFTLFATTIYVVSKRQT